VGLDRVQQLWEFHADNFEAMQIPEDLDAPSPVLPADTIHTRHNEPSRVPGTSLTQHLLMDETLQVAGFCGQGCAVIHNDSWGNVYQDGVYQV